MNRLHCLCEAVHVSLKDPTQQSDSFTFTVGLFGLVHITNTRINFKMNIRSYVTIVTNIINAVVFVILESFYVNCRQARVLNRMFLDDGSVTVRTSGFN